jgi:hypothetical protein
MKVKQFLSSRIALVVVLGSLIAGFAAGQLGIGKLVKVIGIWAVTEKFGEDINKGFNKLIRRAPDTKTATKVVPIITAGISSRNAVGMVQVSGPRNMVDKVKAVAQLEQDILGNEIRIRAMVPIAAKEFTKDTLVPVEQVGVTGIVDVKL